MKDKNPIILLCLASLIVLFLMGCSRDRPSDEVLLGTPVAESLFEAGPLPPKLATPKPDTQVTQEAVAVDYCIECHSDQQKLMDAAAPVEDNNQNSVVNVWSGDLEEMEPWEKVLVNQPVYFSDVHSSASCTFCHGGVQSSDKQTAHQGIIARPSDGENPVCSTCHVHTETSRVFTSTSLHSTLNGFGTALEARSDPADTQNHAALEEMFGSQCATCHTSCGDCHVSQPAVTGGGFIEGHDFNKTPSMTRNCNACHGSRAGDEFMGNHEGFEADVHYSQGNMICTDCHTADQMHGKYVQSDASGESGSPPDNRYAGNLGPQCLDCHKYVLIDNNVMHRVHGEDFSCQVCHSISYTSCDGCHVTKSDETDMPTFDLENSTMTFLIGLNPIQDENHPAKYATLRHIPITESSFESYGQDLLPGFDNSPTWVYSTPHNIQLQTPQNRTCDSCHGNKDIFLTKEKVTVSELDANQNVIVESVPPTRFK